MTSSQTQLKKASDKCNYPARGSKIEPFDFKNTNVCEIKIDEITIAGQMNVAEKKEELERLGWLANKNTPRGLDGYPNIFHLFSEDKKQSKIALIRNSYYTDKWSVDTSNHLTKQEKDKIVKTIKMLKDSRITRVDIAIDFINWEASNMKYRIYKPNSSLSMFYSRYGKLETMYSGKSKSMQSIKYYDKYAEQKGKKKKIPAYINNWERLEIKLRQNRQNNAIYDWFNRTKKAINCLKLPVVDASNVPKINERAIITYLLENPQEFESLAKATRAKYRRKIRELHKKSVSTRTKVAIETLNKQKNKIQREINSFL